jgi:hypothetical protein
MIIGILSLMVIYVTGLRPHCRATGDVPHAHPHYVHELVPHRQRLVGALPLFHLPSSRRKATSTVAVVPAIVAGLSFVVGMLFLKETKDRDLYSGD